MGAMGMGLAAFFVLIVAALVIGLVAQMLGTPRTSYDWLMTAIGAFIGGYVASEFLGPVSAIGPEWDGLVYLPALIGAIVVGAVIAAAVRMSGQATTA